MKNLSTILSVLAFAGVVVLLGMHFSGNKSNSTGGSSATVVPGSMAATGKIAYVNIDTLQNNYVFLKKETQKFEQRQEAMKAELERSAQQLRNDYAAAQRKAQAGTLSEAEGKATEKRLMQMQESLETRKQALEMQLMKEQDEFNKKLQGQLDKVLEEYNKDKKYDYILSYAKGGSIMYANKGLDITQDVLKAMNEHAKLTDDTEKENK